MKNPLYQLSLLNRYAQRIGWPAALRLRLYDLRARSSPKDRRLVPLRPINAQHTILMRLGTSDREVFGQVFIEREYEPVVLAQPKMILDLGANVGYSSAYFLSKYTTAFVLAIEPDPSNYEVCRRNLEPFGQRARVVLGAAWPERSKLILDKAHWRDGRDWTTQVRQPDEEEASAAETNGYDIPSLFALSGQTHIDLLKVDIERSELQLFSRATDIWLPYVSNICIELHDSDCKAAFFQSLAGYSYDLTISGDLTLCLNLRKRQ